MRLTIATPAAHMDIANHYAMALGYGPADSLTYRNPSWQDTDGNTYAVASLPVSDGFVDAATNPLVRPEWDTDEIVDMVKAAQAQAIVTLWTPNEDDPTPPHANPSQIVAVLGMGGMEAIEAMGLGVVEGETPADDLLD